MPPCHSGTVAGWGIAPSLPRWGSRGVFHFQLGHLIGSALPQRQILVRKGARARSARAPEPRAAGPPRFPARSCGAKSCGSTDTLQPWFPPSRKRCEWRSVSRRSRDYSVASTLATTWARGRGASGKFPTPCSTNSPPRCSVNSPPRVSAGGRGLGPFTPSATDRPRGGRSRGR